MKKIYWGAVSWEKLSLWKDWILENQQKIVLLEVGKSSAVN